MIQMSCVDFMLQFDKGTYDERVYYAGPGWAPKDALQVMSQNFAVNYLSYLHDCAYETPLGYGVKEIDFNYSGAIIEETNNIDLAGVYSKWISRLNCFSWYPARIKEWFGKL